MKRFLLSIAVLLIISGRSYGQKEFNNWLFGDHAGLTFNTSPPSVILYGATNDWEGVASISDPSTGELLFYTNGQTVWNRNNQLMPNGMGLFGNTSAEQSALAIRSLVDTSIYYLFTVDQAGYFYPSRGFNYSIIDMRLDSGLGDVSCTNIHVLDSAGEALQAIPRSDQKAYWIIVHLMNSNDFYAYTLSDTGLSSTAVISSVGPSIGTDAAGICGIASTRDGLKICFSAADIPLMDLFDFDPSTGIVSNDVSLPIFTPPYGYLSTFSPDGEKLYTNLVTDDSAIAQFDITSGNPIQIANSKIMLDTEPLDHGDPEALMQAPDGKIYMADGRFEWLSVIENPNLFGASTQFEYNGFDLKSGSGLAGLPNIPAPLLGKTWLTDFSLSNPSGARPSIISFNTDTVGSDYYLYLKVPSADNQNPVHIILSWNANSMNYASVYSGSLVQLHPQVSVSPGQLSLDIDRATFDSIIILDFSVDDIDGAITLSLDSIPIPIAPDCLSEYQSQTITRSFACGYSTLFNYLETSSIPLAIQSIVPNPSTDAVQISFINPTSSAISYQIFDALGQTHLSGVTGENALSLDVSSLPQGIYFFRATNGSGFSASSKIVIVR